MTTLQLTLAQTPSNDVQAFGRAHLDAQLSLSLEGPTLNHAPGPDHLVACAIALVKDSHGVAVYRVTLGKDQRIVKLGHSKEGTQRVAKENAGYLALNDLQGAFIPKSFGYFTGNDKCGNTVNCLLLEECGECPGRLTELPIEERKTILRGLTRIHDHGYIYTDMHDSNVVVRDGQYRIIDLEDISPHEPCDWKEDWRLGEFILTWCDIGCFGLYQLGLCFRIWKKLEYVDTPLGPVRAIDFPRASRWAELKPSNFLERSWNHRLFRQWLFRVKKYEDSIGRECTRDEIYKAVPPQKMDNETAAEACAVGLPKRYMYF